MLSVNIFYIFVKELNIKTDKNTAAYWQPVMERFTSVNEGVKYKPKRFVSEFVRTN